MKALTAGEMREIDRVMSEEIGVDTLQMMESAGSGVARVASMLLSRADARVLVLAGTGNNGGDGLVTARYLSNMGYSVKAVLSKLPESVIIRRQKSVLERIGVPVLIFNESIKEELKDADLVIDSLLGYGVSGNPRKPVSSIIELANAHGHILSVDIPSGLDPTTGKAMKPCIKASATANLGFPKAGLLKNDGRKLSGRIYVVDIGIPPPLYERFGISAEEARRIAREWIRILN